jgi:hypothetical protein
MPRRKRPPFSPGGVPACGRPYPSSHEIAILRRLARPGAYAQMTRRASGKGYVYCYEGGQPIRNEASGEMRPEEFGRLLQWLEPIGDENADEPRWTARRLPSSI